MIGHPVVSPSYENQYLQQDGLRQRCPSIKLIYDGHPVVSPSYGINIFNRMGGGNDAHQLT
ncbi:MAG: hypothetical protein ACXW1W_15855 [Methylococcaceae bacterium]